MRIGEFSKKFNVSRETVRYYTDQELLTPVKIGNSNIYDQNCVEDMKNILLLKDMDFTIEEISRYFSFFRLSTKHTIPMKKDLLSLFEDKQSDIERKTKELMMAKEEILKKIEEIRTFEEVETASDDQPGFPIELLGILVCPECGKPLYVDNGEISYSCLISGILKCECGYKAEIIDGIVVFEGAEYEELFDRKFEGAKYKKYFEKKEDLINHEQMLPSSYINALTTGTNWLGIKMAKEIKDGSIILDHMTHSGILSNRIIDALLEQKSDFLYIGLDPRFLLIKNFKRILKMNKKNPKAIFMCGDYEKMPLAKESADYIYSCFGTQTYGIFKKRSPVNTIQGFLKPMGKWFELFFYTHDRNMIEEEFKDIEVLLYYEKLINCFSAFQKISYIESDLLKQKGELSFYFKKQAKVHLLSFIGEK
ncbi:MAG: MerR family transcriptional regulator [Thermotogota bacterium]